jgi:RNA polymerase sigma-70 factor (ECF subfamily)
MNDTDLQEVDATVSRLRSEGQAALAELFGEHRDRLRRMVHVRLDRRVAGRVDPSDVLQDAFLDASRQLDGYLADLPMAPFVWLRLLTGQRLMATHRQHLGAQMRTAKREVPLRFRPHVQSGSLSRCLAGRLTSPSRAAARLELQARLHELLERLDPLDREVLSLRHFEELSNNEVADELGITKFTASKRYVRALERFKKALAEVSGLFED